MRRLLYLSVLFLCGMSFAGTVNTTGSKVSKRDYAVHITSDTNQWSRLDTVAKATGTINADLYNVKIDTGLLKVDVNANALRIDNVAVATGTVNTNSIVRDVAIGIDTGTLRTDVNANATRVDSVAVSTGLLQGQITQVGISTGNIQSQLNNVAVATGTLVLKAGDTMTGNLTINKTLTVSTITANGGYANIYISTDVVVASTITANGLKIVSGGCLSIGLTTPAVFPVEIIGTVAMKSASKLRFYDNGNTNYSFINNQTSSAGLDFCVTGNTADLNIVTDGSITANKPFTVRSSMTVSGILAVSSITANAGYPHIFVSTNIYVSTGYVVTMSTLNLTSTGIIKSGDDVMMRRTGSANGFFVGPNAGNSTLTGGYNTGVGNSALSVLTSGEFNTAVGDRAGNCTTGSGNVNIGYKAGEGINTGDYNVSIGYGTLPYNGAASGTTAIGQNAGCWSAGNYNTYIGKSAGVANRTGVNTVAIGCNAFGYSSVEDRSGDNNISIGYNANSNSASGISNSCAIGAEANATRDNVMVLGSTYTANLLNVGIGNTAPAYKLDVAGGGHFTSSVTVSGILAVSSITANIGYKNIYISTDVYLPSPYKYYGDGSGLTNLPSVGGITDHAGLTSTGTITHANIETKLAKIKWELIYSSAITMGGVTSITISGLNGDVDGEYKLITTFVQSNTSLVTYTLSFNTDTNTANYRYSWIAYYTSVTGSIDSALPIIGKTENTTAQTKVAGGEILIHPKSGYTRWISGTNGTAGTGFRIQYSRWLNTADNITQMVITSDTAGEINNGSVIELWAMR